MERLRANENSRGIEATDRRDRLILFQLRQGMHQHIRRYCVVIGEVGRPAERRFGAGFTRDRGNLIILRTADDAVEQSRGTGDGDRIMNQRMSVKHADVLAWNSLRPAAGW